MSITKKGVKRQYGIEPGLVLWLPFDGDVRDYSGNSNHGLNYGASWTTGKIGGALSFNGVDNYINCGSAPSLDDLTTFTYSFWLKSNLLNQNGISLSKKFWWSRIENDDKFRMNISAATTAADTKTTQTIGTSAWKHIVMTFDNSGDRKIYIYINGAESAYDNQTAAVGALTSDAANSLWIGKYYDGQYPFKGVIDEVRIYNRALIAAEIWDLYQRGL